MLLTKLQQKSNSICLILFHLIFAGVVLANFPSGKYFIGWDALNPEFNIPINFIRGIFALWQENYGLGTLGGHGFAATLPHTLIISLLSLIIPQVAIRSVFTFLCLYSGSLGMYFLARRIVRELHSLTIDPFIAHFACLLGALFYMLNIGTVQIFYIQLEAYIASFAMLPWLFLMTLRLLSNMSKKNLFLFLVINFFASLQGFIPSLFLPYFGGLFVLLLAHVISTKRSSAAIRKAVGIFIITLIINSYWLLPLTYYQATRPNIYLHSYNNISSTQHFIDINKKHGDLQDVALIKSYLFDSYELGGYILEPWISHFNIVSSGIGYALFLLSVIGVVGTFVYFKKWIPKAFAIIYLFFFAGLATNAPILSTIINLLQTLNPSFRQAFRIAFTKLSVGLVFSYSIFIAVGVILVCILINRSIKSTKYNIVLLFLLFSGLFYYALPAFQGHFLYNKLQLTIPTAYFNVIDYFKDKEDAVIADFPQDCPEGWYGYNWGYFGSGFYWYALKQPVLSRTFDVWSNYNENYYWEITDALRSEDYARVENILDKYHVKWLLYDPNLFYCRNQKSFLLNEGLIMELEDSSHFSLVKTFNNGMVNPIKLYQNNHYANKSFISISDKLPNIGPRYSWNDNDIGFTDFGTYQTSDTTTTSSWYPFRSLFTKRGEPTIDTKISQVDNTIVFQSTIPKNLTNYLLKIKNYASLENNIPVTISLQLDEKQKAYGAYVTPLTPEIYLDGIRLGALQSTIKIADLKINNLRNTVIYLNGIKLTPTDPNGYIYAGIFSLTIPNTITIVSANRIAATWNASTNQQFEDLIQKDYLVSLPQYTNGLLSVSVPKTSYQPDPNNKIENQIPMACNNSKASENNRYEITTKEGVQYMQLIAQNSQQCLTIHFKDIPTSNGYLVTTQTKHITGDSLLFSLLNKDRVIYNQVPFPDNTSFNTSYNIIPPTFKSEIGYDAEFTNISENDDKTINNIADIRFYPIPYNYLKAIRLDNQSELQNTKTSENTNSIESISHTSPTSYTITINPPLSSSQHYLILSQSYDPAWDVYAVTNTSFLTTSFPFLFGKKLQDHILVNNWANGWKLDSSDSQIVIFFWPQYLEFAGFGLLILLSGWIIFVHKKQL